MIENIRKYNILIIIGLVVVAAGLVITMQSNPTGASGGAPYLKIGTRTYSDKEYRQLGISSRDVVESLAQAGDFQRMYQFLFNLSPDGMFGGDPEKSTEQFFINRMLVRQASDEFGIHPSNEQIDEYIRSLAAFRGADGEFDPESYALYRDRGLGRMGMRERHLRELVADIITTNYINAVVSSGLLVHPDVATKSTALDEQSINGSVARLELAPFKEQIKPTNEDLKAHWELIKDAFKTAEQRRFSYILVAPEPVKEQAKVEEEKAPTLAEAAMTAEQKAAAAKEKAEKEAEEAAKIAKLKRDAQRKADGLVDDFTYRLEEGDETFEDLIAEYGWEIRTSELFSVNEPPTPLALKLRSSRGGSSAASELFKMVVTSDPISRISQPIAVGENQWLVARLEETVKSRVKDFDEAREQVSTQYINEKAAEELKKAMEEAAEKVAKSLEGGKSFIDATVDAGLKEVSPFDKTSRTARPDPLFFPSNLFQLARTIKPGEISEAIIQGDTAYLVYVSAREIVEGVNTPESLDNQLSVMANQNSMVAFADWLSSRAEASQIERFYRQQ